MRQALLCLSCFLLTLSALSDQTFAQSVVINFDDLALVHGDPIPLTQYADQGVVFTSASASYDTAFVWAAGGGSVFENPSGGTTSPPKAIKGVPGLANVSVIATFVDPVTGEPATASHVEVHACSGPGGDPLSDNVALIGYDGDGNVIAGDYPEANQQYELLGITAPNIASVMMVAGSYLDCFDDFTFTLQSAVQVTIDIKPGSYPNCINLGSAGVIPVAILTTDTFDATQIDSSTVTLAGASIKLVGKSDKLLAHQEDVDGDGDIDLVCQVLTAEFMIEPGESTALLEAETFDGTQVRGEDAVCIVPGQ